MVNGAPRRGTLAGHLGMAIYAGFLVEAGAGVRWLLASALIEQATVAVRRAAPRTMAPECEVARRLLAT
ncbi:hypothetical protein AQJ46_38100 [Streptomyces canus]|uniref:Uncharacterized protein n=2 Tax=Streptomyces TaxID=1883 RepID=A0A117QXY1_9ACTN|nr:hypothetical protein AQJ46_38100 [Streptomyces canus]